MSSESFFTASTHWVDKPVFLFPSIPSISANVRFCSKWDMELFLNGTNHGGVCLGWSSRTQFEETWATLLGVLVTQPIAMDQEEETQQEVHTQILLLIKHVSVICRTPINPAATEAIL